MLPHELDGRLVPERGDGFVGTEARAGGERHLLQPPDHEHLTLDAVVPIGDRPVG